MRLVAAAMVSALAGTALAGVETNIASFGFTDLLGSYALNEGGFPANVEGVFAAVAVSDGAFATAGDVTRLTSPLAGTAEFDTGDFIARNAAMVDIRITVEDIAGSFAIGLGEFTITDTTGDTLTGELSGDWLVRASGGVFFSGDATNVAFTDNSDDGRFDGTEGSFAIADLVERVLEGSFSLLFRRQGAFVNGQSFEGVSTQADGLLVPAPAGAALLAGGLMVAGRRRRG